MMKSSNRRVDVSICIASFRRPKNVARLLASIGRMKQPEGVATEVVLVDNDAATDPAHPVAEGVTLPGIDVRHLREPRRHLTYARVAALEASRGGWIAFVDEDAMVEEGWLAAFWRRVEDGDADGYFGPVLPQGSAVPARLVNALVRRPVLEATPFDLLLRESDAVPALSDALERAGACLLWCEDAVLLGSERPGRPSGPRATLRRWIRAFEKTEPGSA